MSHKKKIGTLLSLSLVGFVTGIILTEPVTFRLCNPEERFGCIDSLGVVGQPLGMLSFVLAIVFLVLFFLHQAYFKTWLKFAAWYIPVAILWIVTTSDNVCREYLPICFDKELATWWSSGIYLVLSLAVITITYFKRGRGMRSAIN